MAPGQVQTGIAMSIGKGATHARQSTHGALSARVDTTSCTALVLVTFVACDTSPGADGAHNVVWCRNCVGSTRHSQRSPSCVVRQQLMFPLWR